jgi:hypothetical protein
MVEERIYKVTHDTVEKDYRQWLSRSRWLIKYLTYLSTYPLSYSDPLTDSYTRDYAIRDLKHI